jgi:hypothetical protein
LPPCSKTPPCLSLSSSSAFVPRRRSYEVRLSRCSDTRSDHSAPVPVPLRVRTSRTVNNAVT